MTHVVSLNFSYPGGVFQSSRNTYLPYYYLLFLRIHGKNVLHSISGYGHISPSTNTGRAITIIYAVIGIPIFLILLADFGKLFTRSIKFVWAFVRRLYYTGSLRRVRKQAQVQVNQQISFHYVCLL